MGGLDTKVYFELEDGTEYVAVFSDKRYIPEGLCELWIASHTDGVLAHHKGVKARTVLYEDKVKLP
ncbi:hypothetical protein [Macrococcus capreoli]|uniref:hypothetical protein n=1 Tax=Macrococcus capreoli TaxID=2982690 RepID=UPI0021D5B92D|nr:hypothetical protein [Macrococcus sp. TMW 2.2395]MCU7556594.1 hypothetical protein [Macrococcus sp. TMW 2.2395]